MSGTCNPVCDGRFYGLVPHRQASLENRLESVEKLLKEQIAGELQAKQTAAELAATDLASLLPPPPLRPYGMSRTPLLACGQDPLNDPLGKSWSLVPGSFARRRKQIERWQLMVVKLFTEQITDELMALQPGSAAGPCSANDRQASLETHTEFDCESLEILTTEQITSEVEALQTAGQLAARCLAAGRLAGLRGIVLTKDLQASLENRLKSVEQSMKEQNADALDDAWDQEAHGWALVEPVV